MCKTAANKWANRLNKSLAQSSPIGGDLCEFRGFAHRASHLLQKGCGWQQRWITDCVDLRHFKRLAKECKMKWIHESYKNNLFFLLSGYLILMKIKETCTGWDCRWSIFFLLLANPFKRSISTINWSFQQVLASLLLAQVRWFILAQSHVHLPAAINTQLCFKCVMLCSWK